MREKASLTVAGYRITEMGPELDGNVLSCFRDADIRVDKRTTKSWHQSLEMLVPEKDVRFVLLREDAISRLDVLGFTIKQAEQAFSDGVAEVVHAHEAYFDDGNDEERLAAKAVDFSAYSTLVRACLTSGKPMRELAGGTDGNGVTAVLQLLEPDTYPLSFPSVDIRWAIRVFLEFAPGYSELILDISSLYNSGQLDDFTELCADARAKKLEEHSKAAPTLVLTEGSTDSEFLRRALAIIYPHLVGYLNFLDFGSMKLQGGASELVKSIKSFASAGLTNRVVAIADSDAAARDAMASLDNLPLPSNMKVLTYPPTALARNYPTIGPSGEIQTMDIMGRAASIEMYFGEDILRDQATRQLAPVRWTAYIKSQQRYQGEIDGKTDLQNKFRAKLKSAEAASQAGQLPELHQFSDMKAVLDAILTAFH